VAQNNNNLLLLELSDDPLQLITDHIVNNFVDVLPDLSKLVVLLPESGSNSRFRQCLINQCRTRQIQALLGPELSTLKNWVSTHVPVLEKTASGYSRELILLNALLKYPHLYKESSPWALTDSLLRLFDELTLNKLDPFSSEQEFTRILQNAYGVFETSLESLNRESKLVYSLWKAWHEQLAQEKMIDNASAWLTQLGNTESIDKDIHFYLVADNHMLPAEKEWLKTLYHRKQLTLVLYKNHVSEFDFLSPPDESRTTSFLSCTYDHVGDTFPNRVEQAKSQFGKSDAIEHISTALLNNAESEAIAVDIQVRQWLIEGKRNIGIVTNDRRLGRRVRALLERAHVNVQDNAGWALSTTRAAAVLERWIQTIEEDFNHVPMLDVLKSSFILPDLEYKKRTELVYRLEQDIVRHENIGSNLERFRKHIDLRTKRLNIKTNVADDLHELLNTLEQAAAPLTKVIANTSDRHQASYIIDSLLESLKRIGMYDLLEKDIAGCRLLQEIILMQQSARQTGIRLNWIQWREWLGKTLEQYNFVPPSSGCFVQLTSIEQSGLVNFDAVIIAGADSRHLPGSADHTPFFNENVYIQLGLPSRYRVFDKRFFLFRRLIESSSLVLVTSHVEENNETLQLCPWVEVLEHFHQMVFEQSLRNNDLITMVNNPQTQIFDRTLSQMPMPARRPSVSVPESIIPDTISVSAHQHLIDCPYKFFVHYCLHLKPSDEVREALEKSDYGSRVHLCLQAFHSSIDHLPGPFIGKITDDNMNSAITMLEDISLAVFKQDIEDSFEHRGWYNQWRSLIPVYIDWQKMHNHDWTVLDTEKKIESILSENIKLKGCLDRIDQKDNTTAILDYKTGQIAARHELESGESIQLPSYKLLSGENTKQVAFLAIDKNKISKKNPVSDDELESLANQVNQRLVSMFAEIHQQQPVPAWRHESTCRRCEANGICRVGGWSDE